MLCSAHRELKNGEEGVEIAGDDGVSPGVSHTDSAVLLFLPCSRRNLMS